MSRKRKQSPKSPADILAARLARRAQDFEAVGLQGTAAALPNNDAVEVRREGRRNAEGARRLDAFEALRESLGPGAYDAARRLERDLAIRAGEHGRGRSMLRVDCDAGKDRTDEMLAAGERVQAALSRLARRDGLLLVELIRPSPAVQLTCPTWRSVVAQVTGEVNDRGQAAIVRNVCANLAEAYQQRRPAAA